MFFAKFVSAVRKLTGMPTPSVLNRLHSVEGLRRILDRERSRADRTGDKLALAVFTPRSPDDAATSLLELAKILNQRLRSTDEAGWLEGGQIGVVLPCTAADGAWKLAEDVCAQFPAAIAPPLCSIYCYPSNWYLGETSQSPVDVEDRTSDRRVHALEMLFLQPMPWWKRTVDVLGSGIGLLMLLPLLAVVALAIKLTSRGPVFFKQRRSGKGGKPFVMYKFRSMVVDAEARKQEILAANEQDGPAFKIKNDPRVTRVGRFLRATSLDELPQLWNVLKGDMSLVGPRPLPCAETEGCIGWQRQRLDVTPGLTCLWQVRGRSKVSFADWVRMDVQYIRAQSPAEDLKLLLMTVPAVISRKGAH